jgi:hypothetical protein
MVYIYFNIQYIKILYYNIKYIIRESANFGLNIFNKIINVKLYVIMKMKKNLHT